ncbi:ribosomal protein L10 [Cucumis melo var. makuwa]|uniref:Ribosomal protein L10 n=1 Tax=Cucumis melo var. makuwa TaxID=1194695 RepID=A0A5A7TKL5_CUCMM|nr:ribosomal protein L10 [Cucumis melo var. makuwa]TYK17900.1 ribosomal protein L10 [Cucumis melo var. makuwa]
MVSRLNPISPKFLFNRKKKGFFAQLAHSAGPTFILYLSEEGSDSLEFLPSWDSMDQDLLSLYGKYRSSLVDHMDVEKKESKVGSDLHLVSPKLHPREERHVVRVLVSSHCLEADGFIFYFTPRRGFFSPFPHGTTSLSISQELRQRLARWSLLIHMGFHVPHATQAAPISFDATTESLLLSFPLATKMFQFARLSLVCPWTQQQFQRLTSGSTLICNSPKHFVADYTLPRLWVPRYPPSAFLPLNLTLHLKAMPSPRSGAAKWKDLINVHEFKIIDRTVESEKWISFSLYRLSERVRDKWTRTADIRHRVKHCLSGPHLILP